MDLLLLPLLSLSGAISILFSPSPWFPSFLSYFFSFFHQVPFLWKHLHMTLSFPYLVRGRKLYLYLHLFAKPDFGNLMEPLGLPCLPAPVFFLWDIVSNTLLLIDGCSCATLTKKGVRFSTRLELLPTSQPSLWYLPPIYVNNRGSSP